MGLSRGPFTTSSQCARIHFKLSAFLMIAYHPKVPPPPNTSADMAHSAHSTQPALRPHRTHTALPQGRRQPPVDAPTPFKRSLLTPFGGLMPVSLLRVCRLRVTPVYVTLTNANICLLTRTVVVPPLSVVQCLWEVFGWWFRLLFLSFV